MMDHPGERRVLLLQFDLQTMNGTLDDGGHCHGHLRAAVVSVDPTTGERVRGSLGNAGEITLRNEEVKALSETCDANVIERERVACGNCKKIVVFDQVDDSGEPTWVHDLTGEVACGKGDDVAIPIRAVWGRPQLVVRTDIPVLVEVEMPKVQL